MIVLFVLKGCMINLTLQCADLMVTKYANFAISRTTVTSTQQILFDAHHVSSNGTASAKKETITATNLMGKK